MGKFLRIYFWQIVSLILNFGSMFIVTPYISSNKAIFGIYSLIIATSIFFAYSDLGFLSAGLKYACEYFAKNDRDNEIKVIGFAGFILTIFIAIYSITLFVISFYPQILVKSLSTSEDIRIAHNLLLILALYAPFVIFQRVILIIFSVRMEDYKFQRILIFFNLLKIVSALYFFGNGKYQIVGYFLFSQLCNIMSVLVGFYYVKRYFNYDLRRLFLSFKFSSEIYNKTKALAYSSLFITVCWILYYEIDLLVIGRTLGATQVAIFAIGLTILSYFRTLFGIFYSPFIARFNYFIGLKDHDGLKDFFIRIVKIGIPFTVFPVLLISLTAKTFILDWVGAGYFTSIPIAKILVLSYIFSFLSHPAGVVIMAYEKLKMLNITSAIQPFIYWLGILLTFNLLGLRSFAYFKFLAFAIDAVVYYILISKLFKINVFNFAYKTITPALPAICFLMLMSFIVISDLHAEKSKLNLLLYLVYCGVTITVSVGIYYFCSKEFKAFVNSFMLKCKTYYLRNSNLKFNQESI